MDGLTPPALGVLEIASVARGMIVADAVVKKAEITLFRAEAFTPGKFIVMIVGGEAEVEVSMSVGIELAHERLIDHLLLPHADAQLLPAIRGDVTVDESVDSLAIVECEAVSSALRGADLAVKATETRLVQMQLARGLGGRAYFTLTGTLAQIEAAVDVARREIHVSKWINAEIIARPHVDFLRALMATEALSKK